jgi:flagellin
MRSAPAAFFSLIAALALFIAEPLQAQTLPQGNLYVPDRSNFVVYSSGGKDVFIHERTLIQWGLDKEMRILASGKRIVSAADDPSGLAVAQKMEAAINSLKQEAMNAEDYRNFLRYVESVLAQDIEILKRVRLLAQQASGGIYGPDEREIIQVEIAELLGQIDMNAGHSSFNTIKVAEKLTVKGLGLSGVNVVRSPDKSMDLVDEAMEKIMRKRVFAGIRENVLGYEIMGKTYYRENLTGAMSGITDADMGEHVGALMRQGVKLRFSQGILIKGK